MAGNEVDMDYITHSFLLVTSDILSVSWGSSNTWASIIFKVLSEFLIVHKFWDLQGEETKTWAVMLLFQLFLMVLLSQAQEPVCRLHGHIEQPELHVNGDLIIGGIFSFRTGQESYVDIFRSMPAVRPCREYVYLYTTTFCVSFLQ